jgi:hypothetical protein
MGQVMLARVEKIHRDDDSVEHCYDCHRFDKLLAHTLLSARYSFTLAPPARAGVRVIRGQKTE